MPATTSHMTTNFDRIERGVLDHKRENTDAEAAKTLKGLLKEARTEVKAAVREQAKTDKVKADVSEEAIAQRVWDLTIAKAVAAGVQTSIPGTRGNEFRRTARQEAKALAAATEPESENIEDEPTGVDPD